MSIIVSFAALLFGVAIYRLGRRDGEVGRVMPLFKRTKAAPESQRLLNQIERYDGNIKEKR